MVQVSIDQNTVRRRGIGLRALDPGRVSPGYTLFAPIAGRGEVYLVDLQGTVVHQWALPVPPGRHAKLLPNGNLFYQGKQVDADPIYPLWGVVHGGILAEVDPSGTVVRSVQHPFHHHDAAVLTNGNLLVDAVEPLPASFARHIKGGLPGSEAPGGAIYGDVVYEMTWAGEVVWRWSAAEHLEPDQYPLDPYYEREHWPMCNSVNELRDGSIILGYRSASSVIIVDRRTGDVTWRLGPPMLAQQHYPHELANGNILIFDNGSFRANENVPFSRVIEVERTTQRIVWEYRDDPPQNFYSPYMSSAQRLPNGNTLIAEGSFGRIFEVTPNREVVWEYVVPFFGRFGPGVGVVSSSGEQNAIFRAYRYSPAEVPWLSGGA